MKSGMEAPNLYSLRKDLERAASAILMPFWMLWVPLVIVLSGANGLPPKFSVQLADVRNPGTVVPAAPIFNAARH
jgi:hypothetical protein